MSRIKKALILSLATIGALAIVALAIVAFFVFAFLKSGPPRGTSFDKLEEKDVLRTFRLTGTVKVHAEPITGCVVYVRSPWPTMRNVAATKTDENGEYELVLRFSRRTAENYSLWARHSVSPSMDILVSAKLSAGVQKPSIAAGDPLRIALDMTVPSWEGPLDLQAVVKDRNGLPYPGEEIELHAADKSFCLIKRSDALGVATFHGLQPGRYHLQCLVPERDRVAGRSRMRDGIGTAFASADMELASSFTDSAILVPGGMGNESVYGRLTINGEPLPAVCVTIKYNYGEYWTYHAPWHSRREKRCELHRHTDCDGMYSFPHLPDVQARLLWTLKTHDREIEIDRRFRTTMHTQDFGINATASIRGKIEPMDKSSEVPSVFVVAEMRGASSATYISRFRVSARTTEQGEFLFKELPEGVYRIHQPLYRGVNPPFILESQNIRLYEGDVYDLTMKRKK